MTIKGILLVCACTLAIGVQGIGRYRGLEFLDPCSLRDRNVESCLARSANALTEHFRHGKKLCLLALLLIYGVGISGRITDRSVLGYYGITVGLSRGTFG